MYLIAFPVMAALLIGPRPAMYALLVNAITLASIGYLFDVPLPLTRYDAQPLLKWVLISANFTFVSALVTLSCIVLLHGLQKTLAQKQESEALYRATFEKAPIGVSRLALDGSWLQVNKKLCDITGYSEKDLLERSSEAICHPDDRASGALITDALVHGEMENIDREIRYVNKRGQTIWVHLYTSLVRDIAGAPAFLVESASDITERKRVQEELRIAAIAFDSQEGMLVTDADCKILRVNQSFVDDTGYTAEEVTGRTPRMLRSGKHEPAFYEAMWNSINQTGTWAGEVWNRRKSGEIYPHWLTISAVRGSDGAVTHYVGTQLDISQRKAAEDKIHKLAFYDPQTQLPNRRLLLDRLAHALAGSLRNEFHGALILIDLDNFKTLNDTQGHEVGDRLLKEAALRLQATVRKSDTVARLGGDEFVVMLDDLEAESPMALRIENVTEKILAALNEPYRLEIGPDEGPANIFEHHCTASIGVTLFGDATHGNVDELLKQAELAMYQAKNSGRNTFRFFDPKMQAAVTARAALEDDLRLAVQQNEFCLYYQAQVVSDGHVTGSEALIRWQHPKRGMVSPAEFIPLAEETRLILPLGQWVLETACAQLATWAKQPALAQLTVAVNVSAQQFHQDNFVNQVLAALRMTGAKPERLKLELTESLLVSNIDQVIEKMFALKAKGVGFSLDDFGTGYSSLSYLKKLPLDQLKIDQSFVRDILSDPNDAAIARTIIALGQSLGLNVIAEGVETAPQRDFLATSGCHAYQGYYFARPLPVEGFEDFALQP
jgi:diguanylate cyclase (GGDEF)-like protein/PAS domain S-box-containing protein